MKYTAADYFDAQEAEFNDEELLAKVTLVRPGLSKNRKNWTPAALKRAVEEHIFDGTPMYIGHAPSVVAARNRSLAEIVSGVETTELAADGRIVGTVKFYEQGFYDKAKRAKEHFKTSIDVLFDGTKVKAPDGQPAYDVTHILAANSVDWVRNPAAGGGIDSFMSARESEEEVIDWSKVTLEDLKTNRPELVEALSAKEEEKPEKDTGEKPLTAADVQRAVEEALSKRDDDASKAATARRAIESKVQGSTLPSKTKARVIASFDGATEYVEADVVRAIEEATAELTEVGWKVKGMGASEGAGTGTAAALDPKAQKRAIEEAAPMHAILMKGIRSVETKQEVGK